MHAPRTGLPTYPTMLTLLSYIRRMTGQRPRADPEHSSIHKPRRPSPANVCRRRMRSSAAQVDSGAVSVVSVIGPPGHMSTLPTRCSARRCGFIVAAASRRPRRSPDLGYLYTRWMRKRSCTVARQGGVILSWLDGPTQQGAALGPGGECGAGKERPQHTLDARRARARSCAAARRNHAH